MLAHSLYVGIAWFNTLSLYAVYRATTMPRLAAQHIMFNNALHGFVCMICSLCMIAKLGGVRNDWVKYVEWLVSCPTLVTELGAYARFRTRCLVEMALLSVAFNIAGIMTAVADGTATKVVLGAQGCIFYVTMLGVMWDGYRDARRRGMLEDAKRHRIVVINAASATFLWPVHIVAWILGADVLDAIPPEYEMVIETGASIVIKTLCVLFTVFVEEDVDILARASPMSTAVVGTLRRSIEFAITE